MLPLFPRDESVKSYRSGSVQFCVEHKSQVKYQMKLMLDFLTQNCIYILKSDRDQNRALNISKF